MRREVHHDRFMRWWTNLLFDVVEAKYLKSNVNSTSRLLGVGEQTHTFYIMSTCTRCVRTRGMFLVFIRMVYESIGSSSRHQMGYTNRDKMTLPYIVVTSDLCFIPPNSSHADGWRSTVKYTKDTGIRLVKNHDGQVIYNLTVRYETERVGYTIQFQRLIMLEVLQTTSSHLQCRNIPVYNLITTTKGQYFVASTFVVRILL
jgi:hypothetical protein